MEVSRNDATGLCDPLRKPVIPGCGFQSLSPHCSVNSQQAIKSLHRGRKTRILVSHARKHQVYCSLPGGYWGDISVLQWTTQINHDGLLAEFSPGFRSDLGDKVTLSTVAFLKCFYSSVYESPRGLVEMWQVWGVN